MPESQREPVPRDDAGELETARSFLREQIDGVTGG